MCATPGPITEQDVDEFTRTFARSDGFAGASGLYRSMLNEGEEIQGLAAQSTSSRCQSSPSAPDPGTARTTP
jgi:hypothetical protein